MRRIPVHTIADTPANSATALQKIAKQTGQVLNIFGEMAHSPVVMAACVGIGDAIARHGSFDARTKEAFALTVGAINSCAYCQSAHTISATRAGLAEEQNLAIRGGNGIDDTKVDALLRVVRKAATDIGSVDNATWTAAVGAGWTETQRRRSCSTSAGTPSPDSRQTCCPNSSESQLRSARLSTDFI
ncbi:carboxymuconolactone decarboxylase family protein [Rhodococcus sp. IEGM 1318]|uniref:carboxymuconolactone decarboxylase family protein n=1 Tax=Rhodococcus sp. IEGM 1318 TaxID=3082226 RepID=UPI0029533DB6|nr:carboxymuconolactone decarboxylase family protein [Rhodococcus sp. IEGM 1318]MDV8009169.1 carboxymuconolactone decarboxylase family protein [Rhodococcus sp. IEGM 1318]